MRRGRVAATAVAVLVVAAVATGAVLWWYASSQLNRREIEAIQDRGTEPADGAAGDGREGPQRLTAPVEFLVVGSDDRSVLTPEERQELTTGSPTGPPRSDVILLVQVRPSDGAASLVSFPRDLTVTVDGADVKINSLLAEGGPELLVRTVEDLTGLQLDHYVEVSIPAFLTVVDAVGGVEVCLDEPLRDEKSGADLPAGCHELAPAEALAFVRSREGGRGDFRRIDRQQQFLQALADELTSARTLLDVPRLFRIANRLASSVTTDQELALADLRQLAEQFRGLAAGEVVTATVPAYATSEGGTGLELYEPGAEALFSSLRQAEPLAPRGSQEARAAARVVIWNEGAPTEAAHIESVLYFLGFAPDVDGGGPGDPARTVVYAGPADATVARWVANILGAEVRDLPAGASVDPDVDAVVAVAG